MSSDRFHKAAKDGLLDVLKEATRKEANSKDADSMTPVLWASFEGRLDALRLLVGRGGDPDKCDQFGNTALHLASAKGHLRCVDFLVKFGVNLYALDIDKHSPKDLAAINNRDDILRYLDAATAALEANEKKKSKALKELAEKNCEKRIREYSKRQQRLEEEYEKKPASHRPSTMLSAIKHRIWSSSQGNLKQPQKDGPNGAKFSELVNGTMTNRPGAVQKRVLATKMRANGRDQKMNDANGFKIGEIEANGQRTITSLTGLQRDSEVLYVGTFSSNEDNGKRGKIADVFDVDGSSDADQDTPTLGYGTLSRSFSQPDFLANHQDDEISNDIKMQRPSGLFDRPMLGSIAFRRSVTAALNQLHPEASSIDSSNSTNVSRTNSSLPKMRGIKPRSFLAISDSDSEDASESEEDQEDSGTPIQRFLTVWGLEEYLPVFYKQQVDLDTLMLLTEADLKSLELPLGPFRKLTFAIQERRNALANPGAIQDSRL